MERGKLKIRKVREVPPPKCRNKMQIEAYYRRKKEKLERSIKKVQMSEDKIYFEHLEQNINAEAHIDSASEFFIAEHGFSLIKWL